MATKQTNIVSNVSRSLIFFEESGLCYNYKTGQWSRVPAYGSLGMYTVNDNALDIGLVRYSSGSVDLQEQALTDVAQNATLSTGAVDLNKGGRVVVNGVRPLANGGTYTVQVGSQDSVTESADWSSAMSVNSRTGMAPFRKEGRYARVSVAITGGFNQILGVDVDFNPQGKV